MAGTIVADTLQDGAGNSTAMDNAIYGSAKAWVSFNGVSGTTIRASYNVSSVTRTAAGYYTITFTNAFVDQYYSCSGICQPNGDGKGNVTLNYATAPTASACYIETCALSGNQAAADSAYIGFQAWR